MAKPLSVLEIILPARRVERAIAGLWAMREASEETRECLRSAPLPLGEQFFTRLDLEVKNKLGRTPSELMAC